MIDFKPITDFPRGTMYELLLQSYAQLLEDKSEHSDDYLRQWKAADDQSYDHLETVGICSRIS